MSAATELTIKIEGPGQLAYMEIPRHGAFGSTRKKPQCLRSHEETGRGQGVAQAANAKGGQKRPTCFSIFRHQLFQHADGSTNGLRRHKAEPLGEIPVGYNGFGLRQFDQDPTQPILQHVGIVIPRQWLPTRSPRSPFQIQNRLHEFRCVAEIFQASTASFLSFPGCTRPRRKGPPDLCLSRGLPFANSDECRVICVPDQHLLDAGLPERRKALLLVLISLLCHDPGKQYLHLGLEWDDRHIEV